MTQHKNCRINGVTLKHCLTPCVRWDLCAECCCVSKYPDHFKLLSSDISNQLTDEPLKYFRSLIPFLLLAEDWNESHLESTICPSVKILYQGKENVYLCVAEAPLWVELGEALPALAWLASLAGLGSTCGHTNPQLGLCCAAHLAPSHWGSLPSPFLHGTAVHPHEPAPHTRAMHTPHPIKTAKQELSVSISSFNSFLKMSFEPLL